MNFSILAELWMLSNLYSPYIFVSNYFIMYHLHIMHFICLKCALSLLLEYFASK